MEVKLLIGAPAREAAPLSSPFLILLSKGESSCAMPFIPEADRMNRFSDRFRPSSFAILTLKLHNF